MLWRFILVCLNYYKSILWTAYLINYIRGYFLQSGRPGNQRLNCLWTWCLARTHLLCRAVTYFGRREMYSFYKIINPTCGKWVGQRSSSSWVVGSRISTYESEWMRNTKARALHKLKTCFQQIFISIIMVIVANNKLFSIYCWKYLPFSQWWPIIYPLCLWFSFFFLFFYNQYFSLFFFKF
jgi:hypothetical protein